MVRVVNENGLHELHAFIRSKHKRGDTGFAQPMLEMIHTAVLDANEQLAMGYSATIIIDKSNSVTGQYEDYTVTDNGLSEAF